MKNGGQILAHAATRISKYYIGDYKTNQAQGVETYYLRFTLAIVSLKLS